MQNQSITAHSYHVPDQPVFLPLTSLLHGVVWLCFLISSFVFINPAPVDGLMVALVLFLPLAGMTRFSSEMYFYLAMMLIIVAGAIIGVSLAFTVNKAVDHVIITFYLALFTFVLAGFIAKNPHKALPLIMNGWTIAAWLAVITGLTGYFSLFPGAEGMFTKYQRITGGFKDPNVFGTFIIPPALYALYRITNSPTSKTIAPLATLAILALGVLLSFSRGAWINFALATLILVYISYVTSPTNIYRVKLVGLGIASILVLSGMFFAALQVDKISALLTERAKLTQSYDTGDDGRFSGQAKARNLIPQHPLGIGPNQFGLNYHNEAVHNVYYNLFLNSGWLGGFAYLVLVFGTVGSGFRHLFRQNTTRGIFLVVYAAFIGNVMEGLIIDTDHWRHFFVLLSMIWGITAYERWQKAG